MNKATYAGQVTMTPAEEAAFAELQAQAAKAQDERMAADIYRASLERQAKELEDSGDQIGATLFRMANKLY